MPFVEVTKRAVLFTSFDFRPLSPGDTIQRTINGRPIHMAVGESELIATVPAPYGSSFPIDAAVCDPEGLLVQPAIVWVSDGELDMLDRVSQFREVMPVMVSDVVSGLWRRAEEDTGMREIGQRSLLEQYYGWVSQGLTEMF